MTKYILSLAVACLAAWGQTEMHGLTGKGTIDLTGSTRTAPCRSATGSPIALAGTVGDCFFQTNATAGSNLWLATSSGTPAIWSQISATGGSGGGGNGLTMSVNTGADTMTLTASRIVNFQRGKEVTTIQAGETFTWTNATAAGDYIVYYNGGMVLSSTTATVASQSTTSSRPISSTVNATTGLQLPQGSIPLYAGTVTGTTFTTTSVSLYAGDQAPYIMDVDASLVMTPVGGDTLRFGASGGGVSDGDKGQITVSGGGLAWSIDPGTITLPMMSPGVGGCATLKAGVGGTTSNLTPAVLASIPIPALNVGEVLMVSGFYKHNGTPTATPPNIRMGFGSGPIMGDYAFPTASRTWLKFWAEVHYVGTTESWTVPWGRDSSGSGLLSITTPGTADSQNLSSGSITLSIQGNLVGSVGAGESISLASYYVQRCLNVP